MNEIEAALGVSQLSQLNKFLKERTKIAKIYKKNLDYNNLKSQYLIPNCKSSMHLFIIRVKSSKRNLIIEELKKNNINTNLHYIPIYRHSFYKKFKFKINNFKNAEKYFKEAISIPIYCGLKKIIQMKIIDIINKIAAK
jgi:dTDP-4-amino-4,6-dideoxygalactose transaminase